MRPRRFLPGFPGGVLGEIVPALEKALGGWKSEAVPAVEIPARPHPAHTTVYLVDKPAAAQSVLLVGQLLPPRNNPDVREDKGYTYGAYCFAQPARGQSPYLAITQVRTGVTKESLAELTKELRDVRGKRPVTEQELREAQDSMTRSLPGEYDMGRRDARRPCAHHPDAAGRPGYRPR
jgi:predicted Zn-dependent peptidase